MSMWSRRRDDATGPYLFGAQFPYDVIPGAEPAELVGIANHDHNALYQFETTDGTYVTLHDLDCSDIGVRPREQTLTLTFTDEAVPGPVLRMHFEGARILRWRLDTPVGPRRYSGQVRDLWWDRRQTFALYLADDEIAFTATRLTVTTGNLPTPG